MSDAEEFRPLSFFPRRTLIKSSMFAAGAALAAGSTVQRVLAGANPAQRRAWEAAMAQATPEAIAAYKPAALTAAELATLVAVIDRIIPADELGPSASEAGAQIYIDKGLGAANASLLPGYQSALAALDTAAGGSFAAASATDQDALLTKLENDELEGAPEGFFPRLLEDTRSGLFCDPVWGGNANFVGWDLIGYPGLKLVWTEADQELGADVEPVRVSVEQFGGKGW
jgi:gluconate 2-dehydrogenase gamma chain